jgi:hypothetical protein
MYSTAAITETRISENRRKAFLQAALSLSAFGVFAAVR